MTQTILNTPALAVEFMRHVAPDGVPVETAMPRALETNEIPGVIAEYVVAARNAIAAGMDGMRFIQAALRSSLDSAAWVKL